MGLISVMRINGLEFEIQCAGHRVRADMSRRDGGFSPAELLAGALGSCIAMSVQNCCDKVGCKDGDVSVRLTTEFDDGPRRISGIVVDVGLPRDVPEGEMERIRRAAAHCVIHETLTRPPRVDVEFD